MAVVKGSFAQAGQPVIDTERCTHCGFCVKVCPADILSLSGLGVQIDREFGFGCIGCGHCMMICPTDAMTVFQRDISVADVQPLPPHEQRASADALQALLQSRRSTRHFKADEVDRHTLDRIIEMASMAPMGIPPSDVHVSVVQGRDRVQQLAGEIVRGYRGFLKMMNPFVRAVMRIMMGKKRYEAFGSFIIPLGKMLVENADRGRDVLFWDAPAVMVFGQLGKDEDMDAHLVCTYAMLAAESLGLGSCIIGSAAPILSRNRMLMNRLGFPESCLPKTVLVLGYPEMRFQRAVARRLGGVHFADSLG